MRCEDEYECLFSYVDWSCFAPQVMGRVPQDRVMAAPPRQGMLDA